jgi:hypothetical protein
VHASGGSVIRYVAECRLALSVEPALHPREIAHARRMGQIVRYCPDTGEQWNEMRLRVRERDFDGLVWRRRLAPQNRGLEVEQRGNDGPAIVQRRDPDELTLKVHPVVTEQSRLTLQPADECRYIAYMGSARDLVHDKRDPQSGPFRVRSSFFDEVRDEGAAAHAAMDFSAQVGVERDASLQ